ncbi:helix-turn-helix transcriptional regulator [Limnobaculum xujianqingii]|uniref:helix-turn-helix transcriptional regulator n=1 Tax=Limnobaculum xujianqingii TaxID=2738837 RepID=UPI001127B92F|nr:helix-turn-helix transcriptional regulator [Limnobaculum xujianqingii]
MSCIRELREKANVSQEYLAEKVGLTQGAIGHYELGRRKPSLKNCRLIVSALNELGVACGLDDVFPPKAA